MADDARRMLAPVPLPDDVATLLPTAEPLSLVDPEGRPSPRAELSSPLERRDLVLLYGALVLARRVDTQAVHLGRQGRLGAHPTALGQEAVEVGSVFALEPSDWLFPTYRETMAVVTRGVDPIEALASSQGSATCGYDVAANRVATMAVPLATQALHAAGLGMAAKLRGDPIGVLTFLGDGAASEGDAHEAMNFASVFGAPVVFLLVNNHWAISTPVTRQTHAPSFAHRAIGYGMPGVRVDGNDAIAVHAAVHEALARARRGGGPTLVEAVTYRIEAHTTSDDPTRYRTDDDVEPWRARDPVARLERYLRAEHGMTDEEVGEAERVAEEAAARVRAWADEQPSVEPLSMFEHVYAEPPARLAEQRVRLASEIAQHQEHQH